MYNLFQHNKVYYVGTGRLFKPRSKHARLNHTTVEPHTLVCTWL